MSTNDTKNNDKSGVGVLERPAEKREFEDHDKVTVLYGWNKVPPGTKQHVDKVLFKDGVARSVPYRIVKHWLQGTRPDGKNDLVCGRVKLQAVLPDEVQDKDKDGNVITRPVDENDFAKATGVKPMPIEQVMAQLAGVNIEALATQFGADRLQQYIENLSKFLPPTDPRLGRK